MYLAAFPDLQYTLHDEVAEGDIIAVRWTATGTHKGELNGIAPTGRRFQVTGTTTACLRNGKFIESWSNWDALGLMEQLGLPLSQPKDRATQIPRSA